MLTGRPPFHQPDGNTAVLYERILQGPMYIQWPWPLLQPFSTDIILKLMERDPVKRYGKLAHGAGDVLVHLWFSEVDWQLLKNRRIMAPYLPELHGAGDASAWVSFMLLVVVPFYLCCYRFMRYLEDEVTLTYGHPGDDPHAGEFPDFEYTIPTGVI